MLWKILYKRTVYQEFFSDKVCLRRGLTALLSLPGNGILREPQKRGACDGVDWRGNARNRYRRVLDR